MTAAGHTTFPLVCQLDGSPNGSRPLEMRRYLERRGHEVAGIREHARQGGGEIGLKASREATARRASWNRRLVRSAPDELRLTAGCRAEAERILVDTKARRRARA